MNVTSNVRRMMMALAIVFVFTSGVYAAPKATENKTVEKARLAVEEAAPDDWFTYAEAAQKCMKKKVNLKEAKTWLQKSLDIKETPYNLAVMGDYYHMNKLPEKALEYYVNSLRLGLEQDINYEDQATHAKMMKARSAVIKASN